MSWGHGSALTCRKQCLLSKPDFPHTPEDGTLSLSMDMPAGPLGKNFLAEVRLRLLCLAEHLSGLPPLGLGRGVAELDRRVTRIALHLI